MLIRRDFLRLAATAGAAVLGLGNCSPVLSARKRWRWIKVGNYPDTGLSPRDCGLAMEFAGDVWISDGHLFGNGHTNDLLRSSDGKIWSTVLTDLPYGKFTPIGVHEGAMWAAGDGVWRSEDGYRFDAPCSAHVGRRANDYR